MSDRPVRINHVSLVPWFAIFVVVKIAGHSFAAWSWWWILMPFVPPIYEVVKHFGL